MPKYSKRPGGASSSGGGAARPSTTTRYEETLTILDDDARARDEAREYRKSINQGSLLTDEDVAQLGWDLPTAATFHRAADALRRASKAQRTLQYTQELSFGKAISNFLNITGLFDISSIYAHQTADNHLAAADLLDEMARSWKIAADRTLSGTGAQPRWALRRAYSSKGNMVVAFPLCTLRHTGTSGGGPIDVLIGKTVWNGSNAPDYTIVIIRLATLPRGATFRVVHPAPKARRAPTLPTASFSMSDAAKNIISHNGPLPESARTILQNELLSKQLRNDLRKAEKELAKLPVDDARRTMWASVIFQALEIAARLDETSIMPADRDLFTHILQGNALPTQAAELQKMGYTATQAVMLAETWQQLDIKTLNGVAGAGGSYRLIDLHRLVASRPISRMIVIVCIYTRIGSEQDLQPLLDATVRWMCNNEPASAVAAWVVRHERGIASSNPNAGPRLSLTVPLCRAAYVLADTDPTYAVTYLETMVNANLKPDPKYKNNAEPTLAVCQALAQPDDEPSATMSLRTTLANALDHAGIVNRIIDCVPQRGAVWLLAQAVRAAGAVWRHLAETVLVTPATNDASRVDQLHAALDRLQERIDDAPRAAAPDDLAAAIALAELAGEAPPWLNDAAVAADLAEPADQAPDRALSAFYAIWRRHYPDAGLASFANEAIQQSRPAFAAAQLKMAHDEECVVVYQRILSRLAQVRDAASSLITQGGDRADETLLKAIEQAFSSDRDDDTDHSLADAFDYEVMRLVATCFEHDPTILTPRVGTDPAPLTALYRHTWNYLGSRASALDVKNNMGPSALEVLCAAGARSAETRSEAALIGLFARREYQLGRRTVNLINQSAFISAQLDIDVFLPAVAYDAGSIEALNSRLGDIKKHLDAIGFKHRVNTASVLPTPSATRSPDAAVTQTQLEDALVRYMRVPQRGEGDGDDNFPRALHRLLVKRGKHRAAGVIIYAYVSPHQLYSLARDLRWTYSLNPRLDADELASELAARANFLTEYLVGPFFEAINLSMSKAADQYAVHGLSEFGAAVSEMVTAIVDLDMLQRGRGQEDALPQLVQALDRAARSVGSRPELDASRLTEAAQALADAVARVFPKTDDHEGGIVTASTPSLINTVARRLLNHSTSAASANPALDALLPAMLDEIDQRQQHPSSTGEPAYLSAVSSWLEEISHELTDNATESVRLASTCALHLIQAGIQGGTWRSLTNLDHELVALATHGATPPAVVGRCLLRFWHTFHVAASWCHARLQDLIDPLAPNITADILNGIADVEAAAANEAPSPSSHASRLESAAVAQALAAPDYADLADPYARSARLVRDEIGRMHHALVAPLVSALIYRHTGPLIDAISRLGESTAQSVGKTAGKIASIRPWYLAHAVLRAACTALDVDAAVPPALHVFAAMLEAPGNDGDERANDSVAELIDNVAALSAEDRDVIAPLIDTRQGGGDHLVDILATVLSTTQGDVLGNLITRILSATLPSTNLIDAAQQLIFQNLPSTAQRVAAALNPAGRAYLALVATLTKPKPHLDDEAAQAEATLKAEGTEQLPAVFRDAARTLLRNAQSARPQTLRPRFNANGRFVGFVGDQQDTGARGTFAELAGAHAHDVLDALERQDAPSDNRADEHPGGDARHSSLQASLLRKLMTIQETISAKPSSGGLDALHVAVALEFVVYAYDPDSNAGLSAPTAHATKARMAALAACLIQPETVPEAERALAQIDQDSFTKLEAIIDQLAPQQEVAPTSDEGATGLWIVQRLRTPIASGLTRALQAAASQARELLDSALEHTATAAVHDLDRICHDLAFVASRLAEADIVPRSTGDLAAVRYLGTAPGDKTNGGRLALWCEATEGARSENAYASFSTLRDIIAAYPEPGTFLDKLSQTVEQLRSESASRIDVRIENRELDGTVALLVRNDSDHVDAALDVVSLELRPETGSNEEPQHHNFEIGSAHLDLPAGDSGTTWTPLVLPFPDEPPTGPAHVVCHLRSGAGNVWEVATSDLLVRPGEPRRIPSQQRYQENADIAIADSPLYGRTIELEELRTHLMNRSDRARGIKMVGAKGVGKTALATAVTQERLTVGGNLDNVFVTTTCRANPGPTLLLYKLLSALATALQQIDRDVSKAMALVERCQQMVRECVDHKTPLAPSDCLIIAQHLLHLADDGICATFVVDEAQELLACSGDELSTLDEIAADTHGVITWFFVGTGSLVDADRSAGGDALPPLLARAVTISVGHFPVKDRTHIIYDMLDDPQVLGNDKQHRLRFTTDAAAYIAEYTGGHARAALKIANIVLNAALRGEHDLSSPFHSATKRFVYAADVQWALTGGGAHSEDESAYVSVLGDFREIEHRPGVEMALRALQKLIEEHRDTPSVEEIVDAARDLDDERNATPGELAPTMVSGLHALATRDFITREARSDGIECYRFSSVLYKRFAHAGYHDIVVARLSDIKQNGHVSSETLAAEDAERERGLQQLLQENIRLEERVKLAERERERTEERAKQQITDTLAWAQQQINDERERNVRNPSITVNAEHGAEINLARSLEGTMGGSHMRVNQANVQINNDITINYTVGQLNQIEQVLLSAGQGDTQAPTDARSIATRLPWPSDHQFRQAGIERLAAARNKEAAGRDVATGRDDTAPDDPRLEHLELQSLADEAYATQFAEASTAMMGKSSEDLRTWLNEDVNRATLAKVGITWNGTGGNPLFEKALSNGDPDLVGTCRNVCVTAMIFSLLKVADFGNYSPVATLLAQETEHLWKHRLMKAVLQNDTARLMLVNWNERGGFTSHNDSLPVGVWAQGLQDGGSSIIGRAELGRFWQLGAHGKPAGADNPWNGTFPASLGSSRSYQLEPAYAPVSVDLLANVASSRVDELLERYERLAFDRSAEGILKVNNLDVLVHALGSAHDADGARRTRYRELVRYFAGIACIRSLRNHASHGAADERRSTFDERSARMLFEVTASDALDDQPELPAITFAAKRGTNAFWSVVENTSATDWAFAVTPAGGGVLLETAKLADELERASAS